MVNWDTATFEEQVAHVREALAKYDTAQVRADGVKVAADGKLDLAEFTSLVFECTFEPAEPVTVAPVGAGAHIAAIAARVDEIFKKADKNKSGTLAGSELKTVFGMLGIDGGKKHVAEALAKYDTDGTKSLDLGEFTLLVKGLHDVDLVEAVFKQADKDNSGTIEAKELKRVLGHFGLMPTEPHVKAAIEGYDTLTKMKDGRIGRKDKKLDLPENNLVWKLVDLDSDPELWLTYYADDQQRYQWEVENGRIPPVHQTAPFQRKLPEPF